MNHFRKVVALCTTRYSLRTDGISPFRVMLRTNGVYNLRYGVKLTWFAWRDSESLTAVSRSCRAIFKQNSRKIAQGANHRRLKTKTPGLLPGQCMWWCHICSRVRRFSRSSISLAMFHTYFNTTRQKLQWTKTGNLQLQSNALSNTKMHLGKKELRNAFFVVRQQTVKKKKKKTLFRISVSLNGKNLQQCCCLDRVTCKLTFLTFYKT